MLPVQVPFHADEPLVSFAARLAAANGLQSGLDLLTDFRISQQGFLAGKDQAVAKFAQLAGIDVDAARARAFKKLPDGNLFLAGQVLRHQRVWRSKFKICPACLRGDIGDEVSSSSVLNSYARLSWALVAVRSCPIHRLLLILPPEEGPPHEFWSSWSPWIMDVVEGDLDQPTDAPGVYAAHVADCLSG